VQRDEGELSGADDAADEIERLQDIPLNPTNRDSLIQCWQALATDAAVKDNRLFLAQVNYQLARIYGIANEIDTSAHYLEAAFEYIESEPGNFDEKARIYQGIGNISLAQGQLYRANYYYNKAAAIVLADSTVQLDYSAKTAILVAGAQSNQGFHRFELALEMNRKALLLSDRLPDGHINRQRPITQLIQTFYRSTGNIDSVAYYVHKLAEVHQRDPAAYDISFLYESKALYYDLEGNTDSVLHYQILKCNIEEDRLTQAHQTNAPINNLFISYANIGGLYTHRGNLAAANSYFTKATRLLEEHPTSINYDHLIVYHTNLADYYRLSDDVGRALAAAEEVVKLQKELYAQQNTQAIAEMNSLYEIQAQERSIIQLNESIRVAALELQQNRLWLIVSVLSALVLAMLLFFLYYHSMQRRARQEKDKVILQQQLLRTQMEPHFIFNTLTALQHYIRRGNIKEAISYLSRFSKLLRSSLELSRKQRVPLEQEIEALENYLVLQQMRFENSFSFKITQPGDLEADAISVPPMLIQPFVENAILHGVDMKSQDGFVHINFLADDRVLEVSITDSGRTQPLVKADGHRSLSGMISRERLALLGTQARIETHKHNTGGTTVTIVIPIT